MTGGRWDFSHILTLILPSLPCLYLGPQSQWCAQGFKPLLSWTSGQLSRRPHGAGLLVSTETGPIPSTMGNVADTPGVWWWHWGFWEKSLWEAKGNVFRKMTGGLEEPSLDWVCSAPGSLQSGAWGTPKSQWVFPRWWLPGTMHQTKWNDGVIFSGARRTLLSVGTVLMYKHDPIGSSQSPSEDWSIQPYRCWNRGFKTWTNLRNVTLALGGGQDSSSSLLPSRTRRFTPLCFRRPCQLLGKAGKNYPGLSFFPKDSLGWLRSVFLRPRFVIFKGPINPVQTGHDSRNLTY